jgi:hypothetical protein
MIVRSVLPGPAGLIVVALCGGLAVSPGCSHEAKPVVQPEEPPPLPPASGTPIGYLVDSARELQLTDDQLTLIKGIDRELAVQFGALETEERTPDPVAPSDRPAKPRGLGFRAGGVRDGAGGAMQGFPGAPGGGAGSAGDPAPRALVISGDTLNHVAVQRARDLRDAIRRALALLDPGQQAIATRVLTEHGIDPDTGQTSGGPGAASPTEHGTGTP